MRPVSFTGPIFGSSAITDHGDEAGATAGLTAWRSHTPIVHPCPDNPAPSSRKSMGRSELGAAGCAGERDDVTDVLHAGKIHEHALEPEPEAGVRGGSILTKLEVPPVGCLGKLLRSDLVDEHVVPLF